MKRYQLKYYLALDRGFKYQEIPDVPSFYNEHDALKYWEAFEKRLVDINFYNDPIVLIRKEISTTEVRELRKSVFE